MKLNNYTEYAFRVLMYLMMHKSEKTRVQEIADFFELSANHLNKIVQQLAKHELVITTRGKNGGVEISAQGEEISLDQLIVILEPREEVAQCMGSKSIMPCRLAGDCKLRGIFGGAREAFFEHLRKYKIKDLI